MSNFAKFIKGSLLLSIASVVVRLSGILMLVPLARLLGPKQLGIYSLVFWLVQSGTMLGRLGVDAAMHRNGAQIYRTNPVATGRLLGVGGTMMGLSFTALSAAVWIWRSPLAEHWLGNKEAAEWFSYAGAILFTEGMGLVLMTGLLSLHKFQNHSMATATGALGRLLLSPLLAWRYGLSGAFLGLMLASLLQLGVAAVSFYRSVQEYRIPLILQGLWQESQHILRFGLPFYAGNALIGLVTLPMMGELGRVAGVETLGQLRIGQSLSQIVGFLPGAIAPVAISVLSEAHAAEASDFQRLRSVHLRGNWLLALTIVTFFSLASRPLIGLLFGDAYQSALPVVIGMSWVALVTVVVENLNLYSLSAGNTKVIALASIIQKVIFVSLTFWLIPPWGGMGFVFGLLIGGLFQLLIMIAALWHKIEALLRRQIYLLFLWSLVSFGCAHLVTIGGSKLSAICPIGFILMTFIFLASFFSILTISEKYQILLIAKKIGNKICKKRWPTDF
ncbi:MAG: oligosaccharide flippase family protein [Oscillatoria princeps RMCB-10]|nr:oligosaccharide flippase family protein [Oscillatoria princeps RMCB-10]